MPKTVGFLACATTLPATLPARDEAGGVDGQTIFERRGDAYEHDLMVESLAPALQTRGMALRVCDWQADLGEFDGIDLVCLGTAWDYQDHPDAFLARLDALAARGVAVCNPPDLVRWNITKNYLRDLEEMGAALIPTLWLDEAERPDILAAFDHFHSDKVVIKRQIGAGAMGQEIWSRDNPPEEGWRFDNPAMIQPFIPSIKQEGEFSFVLIDGVLSHALRKIAAPGDYRIQSLYGGREQVYEPGPQEISAAKAILAAIPVEEPPLYARIDMVRGPNNSLLLMEAELIEPYLYPEQGPQLGDLLASAIARRIAR